jgi:hypothetical protein
MRRRLHAKIPLEKCFLPLEMHKYLLLKGRLGKNRIICLESFSMKIFVN